MPQTTPLTVAAIQQAVDHDYQTNLQRTCDKIRQAADQGAQLVCLQELFTSRYFCQSEDHDQFALAESIPGPSTEALAAVAAEKGVVVVAGLFERRDRGLFHNSAVVLDSDGQMAGCYRKMHIPDDPLFYEKFYFTPGDLGFQAIPTFPVSEPVF